jgi:hypothetical protein
MKKRNRPEIYVSIDIEADGPIPGDYSMLSLGAAAFQPTSRTPIATFKVNLEPLAGASQDPDTMAWWKKQPEAWAAAILDPAKPEQAMEAFRDWLLNLPGKPVFVGYPATYDQSFVHWYMIHFCGEDPLGFQGLDLKTLAMVLLGTGFKQATKKKMPKRWFEGCPPHTHDALDDAIGQGVLFVNLMAEVKDRLGEVSLG